jgi:hypothetical protein
MIEKVLLYEPRFAIDHGDNLEIVLTRTSSSAFTISPRTIAACISSACKISATACRSRQARRWISPRCPELVTGQVGDQVSEPARTCAAAIDAIEQPRAIGYRRANSGRATSICRDISPHVLLSVVGADFRSACYPTITRRASGRRKPSTPQGLLTSGHVIEDTCRDNPQHNCLSRAEQASGGWCVAFSAAGVRWRPCSFGPGRRAV